MIIQHNLPAISSHRNLGINNANVSKNLEKLSSGYRINRAGDDAAGLAISEKMRGQIRGLGMAEQNVSHAINLIQTAEGALQETHAILQRMRELAVQSANGTYEDRNDRFNIEKEYGALMDEIDRISQSTAYNTMKLFEGDPYVRVRVENPDLMNPGSRWNQYFSTIINFQGGTGSGSASSGINIDFEIQISPDGQIKSIQVFEYNEPPTFYHVEFAHTSAGYTCRIVDDVSGFVFGFSGAPLTVPDDFAGGVFRWTCTENNNIGAYSWQDVYVWEPNEAAPQFTFQIGANGTADQRTTLHSRAVNAASLSIDGTSVSTQENANLAIRPLDDAINEISAFRADLGAMHNRLEHTMNNLGVTKENLTAAESTIRDVDMAKEMMEYTKNSILVQASQAMLAQAQSLPQGVLNLLR